MLFNNETERSASRFSLGLGDGPDAGAGIDRLEPGPRVGIFALFVASLVAIDAVFAALGADVTNARLIDGGDLLEYAPPSVAEAAAVAVHATASSAACLPVKRPLDAVPEKA